MTKILKWPKPRTRNTCSSFTAFIVASSLVVVGIWISLETTKTISRRSNYVSVGDYGYSRNDSSFQYNSNYTGLLIGSPTSQLIPSCSNKKIYHTRKDEMFLSSSAKSIFNCNRTNAHATNPLCRYHYPARFFDEECGIGRRFSYLVRDAEAKRLNGTLWENMPRIGYPTLTINNVCVKRKIYVRMSDILKIKSTNQRVSETSKRLTNIGESSRTVSDGDDGLVRCLTERVSHLHVHKAGGTSVRTVFIAYQKIFARKTSLVQHAFFSAKFSGDPKSHLFERAKGPLRRATRYPSSIFAPHQHVLFATVRDPTERFLSSVGQAVGGSGSKLNQIGKVIEKECFSRETRTATAALRCVADYVKTHGTWIELHFAPQALDVAFTTLWQDVPVAVFDFRHLPDILNYLGANNAHARDGDTFGYRLRLLRTATIDDYDEHTLKTVCELYEVDVIMRRSLGMTVPRCDKYIPL